ncbi:T9SS type A sorting domain-containing protein [Paucihalobacter sp.]|uniref:T9SS type A sorting domain-containing protein n=1 Tax=Paucihalobacter sp. TaxID=2850405 RepID=UPI003D1612DF
MKTHITLLLCCICCWLSLGQSITEIEYFYNTNPGFDNATAITPNSNTGNLTQSLSIPVPSDATGFNTLYIRTKDDTNTWSLYDNILFFITDNSASATATNINAAEYFLNTDPGFGNATAITISLNTGLVTENFAIPIDTDLSGFNTFYIRTQDDLGIWSLYDYVTFFITEIQDGGAESITAIEYFIDTDPGFGNGNAISVNTNAGNTTQTAAINLGDLDLGFHNLYIRTQDDLGVWSLYDKRLFFVTPPQEVSPIVAAEYFYDTDPGFGNGTPVNLIPTGNLDEFTVDLSTADLTCDFHDFYIRLINEDGTWSLYDYGLEVEVFDNANPTIVVFSNITIELDASGQGFITIDNVDNGTFDDCELISVFLDQAQIDYTCANLGVNTVTVTATDAEAKVSTLDVIVTVVDNINPVAVAQDITVQLDASGAATITANDLENGSTDNCSIVSRSVDITSFDCTNLGTNIVNFTVTDAGGNTNSVSATVTVEDSVSPNATAQNITVQLDTDGVASITADDVDNGSTDNCSIATKAIDIVSFDCSNLGPNTVTLTITDQSGNSSNTTAVVTVTDVILPSVVTQNISIELDTNGLATITANAIDNGSTDNCTIDSRSLDLTSFDCSNLGDNTVTLSVTDNSGNTGTATATVTVVDNVNPVAVAQNITVQLDTNGVATITATDLDNGSSDNCGIVNRSINISSFDCSNLGANTVTLTVEDASGNSNNTTAIVTVEDAIAPTVIVQNFTVALDASGAASITVDDIDNGSTDNCTINSRSLDLTSFDCSNLGDNTVTLSVTDNSGNTGTATATVTVVDSVNPVAVAQNITVQLDTNGVATITATDLDNGSSDNCGIVNRGINISSFDCSNLGANTVTLTVEDVSGNFNNTTAIVTVEDNIDPIAIGQDITIDISGNTSISITAEDVNNGSSDNCGTIGLSIDVDTFTSPGEFPVVLTVTDEDGNQVNVTVTVTVIDSTLGIDVNTADDHSIKIHPNPAKSILYFETKSNITDFSIIDITGKTVLKLQNTQNEINVDRLSLGVYFIRFNLDNGTSVVKRFVKN